MTPELGLREVQLHGMIVLSPPTERTNQPKRHTMTAQIVHASTREPIQPRMIPVWIAQSIGTKVNGQLWERELERDAATPNRDEFEVPETDPAEADPAEAEPGQRHYVKFKIDGMWSPAHYQFNLADALDAIHTTKCPAIIGLGIFTIRVNLAAYELGVRAATVCPIHGADCEAWS